MNRIVVIGNGGGGKSTLAQTLSAIRGEARLGGPAGCPLSEVTREMFRAIGYVHDELRPRLLALIEQHEGRIPVHSIRSPEALDETLESLSPGDSPRDSNTGTSVGRAPTGG